MDSHSKISLPLLLSVLAMAGSSLGFAYNQISNVFGSQEAQIELLENNISVMKSDIASIKANVQDIKAYQQQR